MKIFNNEASNHIFKQKLIGRNKFHYLFQVLFTYMIPLNNKCYQKNLQLKSFFKRKIYTSTLKKREDDCIFIFYLYF